MVVTKKGHLLFLSMISLLLVPGSALAGGKICLRLYGGLSYLDAGDVNPGTQAFFDWGKTYFAPPPGGSIEGGYQAIHWGYEFGGDIIYELSPKLGIGIGAGYVESSKNPPTHPGMMVINDYPPYGSRMNFYAGTTLSAVPLRIGVFLTLPLNGKLNFTAHAGVSCYLKASYHASWFILDDVSGLLEDPYQTLSTTTDKKGTPIGFQGGVGIEYKLLAKATVFLDAQGRFARFRGLEGSSLCEQPPPDYASGLFAPFSYSGTLFFESVPAIPGEPRLIAVQTAPPAGPGGQPREAAVDFSGVTLQAGIKIHF